MEVFILSCQLVDNALNACRVIAAILSAKIISMLPLAIVVQQIVMLERVEENYALKTPRLYQ